MKGMKKMVDPNELEARLKTVEENVMKIKELAKDAKLCQSIITKSMIESAIKKFASSIVEFKVD